MDNFPVPFLLYSRGDFMIEFYDNDMSTCAQKVRLVLAAKGLDYTHHYLDLRAGEALTPQYLKLNPNGVVPTIVDGGKLVIESAVIITYLDDAYPTPSLSPDTALGRADMLRWVIRPDASLHQACGMTSFALAFRHQITRQSKSAQDKLFAAMPSEKRRNEVRSIIELGLNAPGVGLAIRTYHKAVCDMHIALESTQYLAGDKWTLADATLLPYMLRLDHLGLSWFWDDKPCIVDWYQRAISRPEFAVIEAYLNEDYLSLMAAVTQAEHDHVKQILKQA